MAGPIPIPSSEDIAAFRADAIIGSALTTLTAAKPPDIKELEGVSVKAEKGEYVGVDKPGAFTTISKGKGFFGGTTETLNPERLKQVSIAMPEGETHYYRNLHSVDGKDSPTGFKATAWVETDATGKDIAKDGKKDVLLTYSGYTGSPADGTKQTETMYTVGDGKILYPQAEEVKAFVDASIAAAGGKDAIATVKNYSHSMGAANATVSQLALQIEGIATTSLQFDPVGGSLAVAKAIEGIQNPGHYLHKQLLAGKNIAPEQAVQMLRDNASPDSQNTTSIETREVKRDVTGTNILHSSRSGGLKTGVTRDVNFAVALTGNYKGVEMTRTDVQSPHDGNTATGRSFFIPMNDTKSKGVADPDPIHGIGNINQALRSDRAIMPDDQAIKLAFDVGGVAWKTLQDFKNSLVSPTAKPADHNDKLNPGVQNGAKPAPVKQQK